jgi:large conductance mechanosensitive channel
MKKFLNEFKAFVMRGNVLDLAVGVIIANAFGKITTSLVNNILMPFIGWIFGGTDAANALNLMVKPAVLDSNGAIIEEATVIGFGTFINTVIDFLIIAFIVFIIVKAFNTARSLAERKKPVEKPSAPPPPSKEEMLLTEIRDLLKEKK